MQLKLGLDKGRWGGRRKNSGRKRVRSKGVAHRPREKVSGRTPLHVNFKYRTQIQNKECLKLLKKAILNARSHGLKILHYSLQHNHIHLIIEANSNSILTKGMRSLTVTFAKGLKKGKVQVERFHLHVLRAVREARNAIHYVLFNQQRHEMSTYSKIDDYSSIMSVKNGLELVKKYAAVKKIWIKVSTKEVWLPDKAQSFLFSRGLSALF